jgi:hypothetical protein
MPPPSISLDYGNEAVVNNHYKPVREGAAELFANGFRAGAMAVMVGGDHKISQLTIGTT